MTSSQPSRAMPVASSPGRAQRSWRIPGPVALVGSSLGASALLGVAAAHRPALVGAAVLLAGVLIGLMLVPTRVLPAVALTATLILPTEVLPLPPLLRGAALGIVPLVVWLMRSKSRPAPWNAGRVLGLLLLAWLMCSELFAPLHTNKGIAWLITASIAVAGIALVGPREFDVAGFRRFFLWIATALGAYALVETFVLQANPLYGALYAHGQSLAQTWDGYRAETLMGHPLVNGTVFAAAVAMAAGEASRSGGLNWRSIGRLAVLVGAVVATQSRGAAIAAAAAILILFVIRRAEPGRGARKLALVAIAIAIAAVLVSALAARNNSAEGRVSAEVRLAVPSQAREALRGTSLFGAGPGQAAAYRVVRQLRGTNVALENGYAELTVGLGLLGALLFVTVIGWYIVSGMRRQSSAGEAAALLAVMIAIGGYNAIEGHPSFLVLIGLLVASIAGCEPNDSAPSGEASA
jgi:hypothetical protein